MYRRFQILLSSNKDTNAFINSIRMVCPCKMSPNPPAIQQQQNFNVVDSSTPAWLPSVQSQNPVLAPPLQAPQVLHAHVSESQLLFGNQIVPREPIRTHGNGTSNILATAPNITMPPGMPPPLASSQSLCKTTSSIDLGGAGTGSQNVDMSHARQPTQLSHGSSQTYTAPSSQIPTSAQQPDTNQPPKTTNNQPQGTPPHPIFEALNEATSIYDLPVGVLEHAVGDILREDGFITLASNIYQYSLLIGVDKGTIRLRSWSSFGESKVLL